MDLVRISVETSPGAHHLFDDGLDCLVGCGGAGIGKPCVGIFFEIEVWDDSEQASICRVANEKSEDERFVLMVNEAEICLWAHLEETMHGYSSEFG